MANKFQITETGIMNPDGTEVSVGTVITIDGDLPDKYVNKGIFVTQEVDKDGKTLIVATPTKDEPKEMTVKEKQAAVARQKAARRKSK